MTKLAGRFTYLGFGILAGSSACAGFYKFFNGDFDFTVTLQILISTAAVIAAALSAYAAYKAASITELNHTRFQQNSEMRISSAIRVIKNVRKILSKAIKDSPAGIKIYNPLSYKAAAEMMTHVLNEPLVSEEMYLCFWDAYTVFNDIYTQTEKNKEIGLSQVEGMIKLLDHALERT